MPGRQSPTPTGSVAVHEPTPIPRPGRRCRHARAPRVLGALTLLAALLGGPAASGTQIYRWQEESGATAFGDEPPPGVNATPVELAPEPTGLGAEEAAARLEQLRLEEASREARRRAELKARAARESAAAEARRNNAERCRSAYEGLAALESGRPVYRDEQGAYRAKRLPGWPDAYTGEREYLDEAARLAEIERLRAEAAASCGREQEPQAALQEADERLRARELCEAGRAELQAALRPEARSSAEFIEDRRRNAEALCEAAER